MEAENRGLADLRELIALSALEPTGMPDLFEHLRSLTDDGLPALAADVDGIAAISAFGSRPIYKLPDRLQVHLAALRARHVNTDKIECGSGVHDISLSSIEVTDAMIEAGAAPLYRDGLLSLSRLECLYFAEKVLRCALSACRAEMPADSSE